MAYPSLNDTNIIANVIRKDLATVASIPVGSYSVADFDKHDPLGISFYVYAALRTGYADLEIELFPKTASYWVEEKLSTKNFSSYLDRDFGALGLFTYSLCEFKTCPPIRDEFTAIVDQWFSDTEGLFGSFLTTTLVGLGLSKIADDTELYERVLTYIRGKLENYSNVIFNDSKNIFVAHLWAKETNASQTLNNIRHECLQRASKADCLPRDKVYYSYVLLEELHRLSRKERTQAKQWIEESLEFISVNTLEPELLPETIDEYGQDVVLSTSEMNNLGYTLKPKLSRIMLAVGLIIKDEYSKKVHLMVSGEVIAKRYFRGIASTLFWFAIASVIYYLGKRIGLTTPISQFLDSDSYSSILVTFCLRLPGYFVWGLGVIVPVSMGVLVFIEFFVKKQVDEFKASRQAWHILKEHWWIELGAGVLIGVVAIF